MIKKSFPMFGYARYVAYNKIATEEKRKDLNDIEYFIFSIFFVVLGFIVSLSAPIIQLLVRDFLKG